MTTLMQREEPTKSNEVVDKVVKVKRKKEKAVESCRRLNNRPT